MYKLIMPRFRLSVIGPVELAALHAAIKNIINSKALHW